MIEVFDPDDLQALDNSDVIWVKVWLDSLA